jgi:hypothetical protein
MRMLLELTMRRPQASAQLPEAHEEGKVGSLEKEEVKGAGA